MVVVVRTNTQWIVSKASILFILLYFKSTSFSPLILCLATKRKSVRRGVKEVVKAIRKNSNSSGSSFCILAGNISPLDVIAHLPVLCEDNQIPYCYVQSKEVDSNVEVK